MTLKASLLRACIGVSIVAACSSEPTLANGDLAIESFDVQDDGLKTTLIGRDVDGGEVGRLELVHGLFTVSEAFKPDYPDMNEIVGRKLDVVVKGEQLSYENAGFEPVLHLPVPAGPTAIGAFLADPHVKDVLAMWRLGFDAAELTGDETAYTVDSQNGYAPVYYPYGTSDYGAVRSGIVANSCAGGTTADRALRLTRTVAQGYTYDEYIVSQCCANSTWSAKSCPTNPNATPCTVSTANDGIMSSYGCVKLTVACKGGPNYGYPTGAPTGGFCGILRTSTGMTSCFGTGETQRTFQLKVVAVGTGRGIAAGTATASIAAGVCGAGDFRCTAGTCGLNTCSGTPTVSQVTNAGYTFGSLTWPSANIAQFNYYINNGGSCQSASECLSGYCVSGVCNATATCRASGQGCDLDSECCSQLCGGPPPACFATGTAITMADGSEKAIEKVVVGDVVLGYDTTLGRTVPAKVTHTFAHPHTEGSLLIDGTLRTTAEHPFYANGEWVLAGQLQPGDTLFRLSSSTENGAQPLATPLHAMVASPDDLATYNLEVEGVHDYFAGGYLVHNKQAYSGSCD